MDLKSNIGTLLEITIYLYGPDGMCPASETTNISVHWVRV